MTGAPPRPDDARPLTAGEAFQQAFGAMTIPAGSSEPLESAYKLLTVLADRRTGRENESQR